MVLKRFGASVPEDLLKRFDKLVEKKGYVGRSEALRDAMRLYISQQDLEEMDTGNVATLSIVYQHKPRTLANLTKMQHDSEVNVISTMHVHLTPSHCLEVTTLKGSRDSIQKIADRIGGLSGIEYIRLFTFPLPEQGHHPHEH
ncbi:MAG: nickel-responsive transcriptional regulator NikR [Candidatus Thorarchaeota archaeon]|nr:nickel-responsive transcriptional regulator NikR [Candidatus Thorarchaeota archaeon]